MTTKTVSEIVRFSDLCQFTDKQKTATLAADSHRFTLYGGSRGPGKSYWLRWYLLRYLLKCAKKGLAGVRVGLFCEDYPALTDRQVSKIKVEFPMWLGELRNSQTDGLGFHLHQAYGGGMLALRNLDDPSKYQSSEFAAIAVDELTKNTVDTFNALRGSLRWPGITTPRFVAASNPGSIGHLWVKSYWKDKVYPPELEGQAREFAFVPALPDDNPHLDPSYWQMLETLPPDLARAWRWGEWDVFAGQAFGAWRESKHIVKPFDIPIHWRLWRSVDWGHNNPFCCLWHAQDPDTGRVIVYRELYERELTDREQARAIKEHSMARRVEGQPDVAEKIAYTLADPSMWTRKTFEDRTFSTYDEYAACGVPLMKADNDRLTGKRKVDLLLEDLSDGKPGLLVFSTCKNLIRTLPALPYDTTRVEDVDTEAEDHAYDALRYGLSRVNPRPKYKAPPAEAKPDPMLRKAGLVNTGLASRDF